MPSLLMLQLVSVLICERIEVDLTLLFLVVNFSDDAWVLKHVNVGIFEVPNIANVILVEFVKPLFAKFQLTHKIVTYLKDEGSNLNTLVVALSTIVSCEPL